MSSLRVNKIVNLNDNGPVEFSKGATLPAGKTISDSTGSSRIQINTVGVVTASSFYGDGSNITNVSGGGVAKGKALALTIIL